MDSKYSIRRATFCDVEAICVLIKKHPRELLIPRPIADILQNIDRFLVCFESDKLVGTISWQFIPEPGIPKQPCMEIVSLAVDTKRHLQGIGKALVQDVLERSRIYSPLQVVALTLKTEFFEKLGFVQIDKREIMPKIYYGCLECSKYNDPFTCPEQAVRLQL